MRLWDAVRSRDDASAAGAADTVAAVVDRPGAAPHIGSIQMAPRTAGMSLLSVLAAPLNPLDLLIASGAFHAVRHEVPYVPGSECVGVVRESDIHPVGSWVYAEGHASPTDPGTFADQVLVRDTDVLPLPDGLDPIRAAAVGNSGVAAWLPLVERAELRTGETVLVLGATGAVGQLAVQIARRHGAGRVIGVGRDRAALQRLLSLGADVVVDLRSGESEEALSARMAEAADGPIDVVLDGLYGLPLQAVLPLCSQHARVVNIGNSAGSTANISAGVLRGQQIQMSGFAGLHSALQDKHRALAWLWAALGRGDLNVDVRTVPLADLPEAWKAQASSPHVKLVVLPGDRQPDPHQDPSGALP